jgi:hypothetical protein
MNLVRVTFPAFIAATERGVRYYPRKSDARLDAKQRLREQIAAYPEQCAMEADEAGFIYAAIDLVNLGRADRQRISRLLNGDGCVSLDCESLGRVRALVPLRFRRDATAEANP